jgi:two-component system response regulator AtoC
MQTDMEPRLIGDSAALRALDADISAAARTDAKVLITGETGVGKDLVARLIHHRSARRRAPIATINCAGVPESLIESELFGHVRGSFTGAWRDHAGLFESARNGTVFLDEVGDMSPRMQGVLLRFLETGELQRVGAVSAHRVVDVRVVAATNRNLKAMMEEGSFRADLYYRLSVVHLDILPLRDRADDIPALLDHFLEEYSRRHSVERRVLTAAALDRLARYRWPGNIRELKNVAERIVLRAPSVSVDVRELPAEVVWPSPESEARLAVGQTERASSGAPELLQRMLSNGESFWTAVHQPFMSRDLAREHLRDVVGAGLERTRGNYKLLTQLFNMRPEDYKRFLGFLTKYNCRVPFQQFRRVPVEPGSWASGA